MKPKLVIARLLIVFCLSAVTIAIDSISEINCDRLPAEDTEL